MVSIIIAAHNEGDNLFRTVASILANTEHPGFEVVLIDDGCRDGSFAFLEQEPHQSDRRLRRYRFEQSVGCIRARHQGTLLARGHLLVFLDAHVAVPPGWLAALLDSIERRGDWAAITPNISPLVPSTWLPEEPTGRLAAIDEKLDFVWLPEGQLDPTGLVATVLGCCTLIPKRLYDAVGGFDLGLRRWGCEFIELILKVYAVGGACYYEPSVLVGHLFRQTFPYSMSYRDLNYNKLRTGYIHFPDASFRRLIKQLLAEPEIVEAMLDFRGAQSELDRTRRYQQAVNRRDPDWFVTRFLPGLVGAVGIEPTTSPV